MPDEHDRINAAAISLICSNAVFNFKFSFIFHCYKIILYYRDSVPLPSICRKRHQSAAASSLSDRLPLSNIPFGAGYTSTSRSRNGSDVSRCCPMTCWCFPIPEAGRRSNRLLHLSHTVQGHWPNGKDTVLHRLSSVCTANWHWWLSCRKRLSCSCQVPFLYIII